MKQLILASQSPSRGKLLTDAGYRFEQMDPGFDDPDEPSLGGYRDARALAEDLAMRKAVSAVKLCIAQGKAGVILSSDTITVGDEGELLGKPAGKEDAFQMVKGFSGGEHAVITGCCLINIDEPHQRIIFSDQASLVFGDISDEAIKDFIETDGWRGKSGGYNLYERQAAGWDIRVMRGDDPTTIVGLPMLEVVERLKTFGVLPIQK